MANGEFDSRDALSAAESWLRNGAPVALATVIETWGSAAVGIGGQMAILDATSFAGSVSGGCVEADVIAEAEDVIASDQAKVLSFGISDERAWQAGLACGGKIRVFLQPLKPDRNLEQIAQLTSAAAERRSMVAAIDLPSGRIALYDAAIVKEGCTDHAISETLRVGQSRLATLAGDTESFLLAAVPAPRLIIVGATHIAAILAPLARCAGYGCVVVDPRESFANASRFPGADIRIGWPAELLPALLDDRSAALITLTHAEHIDDEALIAGLRSSCRYIGALGSRKTHAGRVARLKAAGFDENDVARIHAPIGLDLGGRAAGDIAVAILAQVIHVFRGGAATP